MAERAATVRERCSQRSLTVAARLVRSHLLLDGTHHVDAPPLPVEEHHTIGKGEQGVVLAAADVEAGMIAGAALPHDDTAGAHALAAVNLDAQSLAVGLATV